MGNELLSTARIYTFKIPDAYNNVIDFDQFKNKVILIVNVASLCGFTPQYKELQLLYEKYHERGLEILGFPCNQFGNQEPLQEEEIVESCRRNFGVSFPIMKKTKVNIDCDGHESELYKYLKSEQPGEVGFKGVRWNFEKFIVNRKGEVVARFNSLITPLQLEGFIEQLLSE